MKIQLNGEERQIAPQTRIAELLDELGLNRDGVAVAMDRRVIPRSQHADVEIPDGAVIEVIRAVGGG